MKILEQMLTDIKNGENIDLYATIVIAFVLVALSLIGYAPPELIASLTLVVLGFLAISNLVNRRKLEAFAENSFKNDDVKFTVRFPPDLNNDIETAAELWLVGITLNQTVRHNYAAMENALRRGHVIRALLVHPEEPYLEMAAMRSYRDTNQQHFYNLITGSLRDLCGLKQIAPDRIEIRTIRHPLGHGIIAVNPNSASGVFYISYYSFKSPEGSLPKFILQAQNSYWYDFFRKELDNLWNAGSEWQDNEDYAIRTAP